MKMTKKIKDVVSIALNLGYKVEVKETCIEITNKIKGRPGLVIIEKGTAYRNDVSLELTKTIRTGWEMKEILYGGA